jgi:hypothetical protein
MSSVSLSTRVKSDIRGFVTAKTVLSIRSVTACLESSVITLCDNKIAQ